MFDEENQKFHDMERRHMLEMELDDLKNPVDFAKVPSKAFLAELLERARRYGWEGDYEEIGNFVLALHEQAGIKLTHEQQEPYQEE